MFTLKMLSFLSAFSLAPKEGRIGAAASEFVATAIFPPVMGTNGDRWGPMGTNAVCCSFKIPPSKLSPGMR